jgi:glycosyltransferase involved in cell wall biosynthesis
MTPAAGPSARVLRIALVGPVAQSIPPARSGSIETVTAMLADGLVARGQDVTLFATASSTTAARLHAVFAEGYNRDTDLWPWELCELFNLAAAVERAGAFDLIHYQAEYAPLSLAWTRISPIPVVQTVHHAPSAAEAALWSRYPEAPFVAVSHAQAGLMTGLNVAGAIHHAVDPSVFRYRPDPDDYLLFLGRFTAGKGVLEAMEVARRTGHRLVLAAAENEYYRAAVAPLVDGDRVVHAGEADLKTKVALLQGARALLYPLQAAESFGLVLIEAMMCGTPVAALDRGAVRELVDEGCTGHVHASLDALARGLGDVLALDRGQVRARAHQRFRPERMVDAHIELYRRVVAAHRARRGTTTAGAPRDLAARVAAVTETRRGGRRQ